MLAELKRRLPDANNDVLLKDLLLAASNVICAYTARPFIPDNLLHLQVELALILYNRMGMEGETRHTEGNMAVSSSDLPELIRRQLNPYRRAQVKV